LQANVISSFDWQFVQFIKRDHFRDGVERIAKIAQNPLAGFVALDFHVHQAG